MKRTSAGLGHNLSATPPRRQRTREPPPSTSQNDAGASSDHERGDIALNAEQMDLLHSPSSSPSRPKPYNGCATSTPHPLHPTRPVASSSHSPNLHLENGHENVPPATASEHGLSDEGYILPGRNSDDQPLLRFIELVADFGSRDRTRIFDYSPTLENQSLEYLRYVHRLDRELSKSSGTSLQKRSNEECEKMAAKELLGQLDFRKAIVTLIYNNRVAHPEANDVWPNLRNSAKLPAHYCLLKRPESLKEHASKFISNAIQAKKLRSPPPEKLRTEDAPAHQTHVLAKKASIHMPLGFRSQWRLPVELVEHISSFLDRDDIKCMRLVSKELNHYSSQILFRTVVVPFNTEIYGMLESDIQSDVKGKKKVYNWDQKTGNDVYDGHGLDVFRGFGRHISRYGMSFEVNEDALANPPVKPLTKEHVSFWGTYAWPLDQYCRFSDVAGLETTADETPRMTHAFSELSEVKELALSIDSGLGWLNGPDRSIRVCVIQKSPDVFGTLKKISDRRSQAQQELWNYIEASHKDADADIKLASLWRLDTRSPLPDMQQASTGAIKQPEMPFVDTHVIHHAVLDSGDRGISPTCDLVGEVDVQDGLYHHGGSHSKLRTCDDGLGEVDRSKLSIPPPTTGLLYTSLNVPMEIALFRYPIIPSSLTSAQQEWLTETEWAQRAFLSSYMISVMDNRNIFCNVHTFNISRISDCHLSLWNRPDFWDSLPNLTNVTLKVIPSWRKVGKDPAGYVQMPAVSPECAIDPFFSLLSEIIGRRKTITKLTIGWATGGEHAEGVFSRNKLLLPAPLTIRDQSTSQDKRALRSGLLRLPFVEQLTLKNCWITPQTLVQFIQLHDTYALKKLVLDSVSLTGMLNAAANAAPAPPAPPAPQAAHVAAQQQSQRDFNPRTALQAKPRAGSWMNVIDIITPGPNLSDFGSKFSEASADRETNLQSIEFVSCGYVRLPHTPFEQPGINDDRAARPDIHPFFSKRHKSLGQAMLSSRFPLLGEIIQHIGATELAALKAGWSLETGWKDAEEARAAEFDGLAPGGTGRFTGLVRLDDRFHQMNKLEDEIQASVVGC